MTHPSRPLAGPDQSFYALRRPEVADDLRAGDAKLRALMAAARSFPAGSTVIAPEEEHGYIYRLHSGWCARLRVLADGRAQMLGVLLPGDLFGVEAMLMKRQPDGIVALDTVRVDQLPQDQARAAGMADPQIGLRLSWQLAENHRRLGNWVVGLGRGHADERLALLLLDLRARLILGGTLREEATSFRLPLTQGQIGELLGLTAVHVNRTLRRFRDAGLATVAGGEARLGDVAGLHRLAYPMLDVWEKGRPEFGKRAA